MTTEESRRSKDESDDSQTDAEPQAHRPSTYKVLGELSDTEASGVVGRATATSSVTYGVLGTGDSPSIQGVVGSAASGSLPEIGTGVPAGLWGYTDRSSSDSDVTVGFGVYGQSSAPSGQSHGVYGTTSSSDGYGVYSAEDSYTDGNHEVNGNLDVQGATFVTGVGAEAHQTTDVDIPGVDTTVVYDSVIVDDRNEYDPGTGEFTCAHDGDYHVEAQIEWPATLPDNEGIFIHIEVNGSLELKNYQETVAGTRGPTQGISKTVRNLSAGDVITIVADHGDGSTTYSLAGSPDYAQLTISQIG